MSSLGCKASAWSGIAIGAAVVMVSASASEGQTAAPNAGTTVRVTGITVVENPKEATRIKTLLESNRVLRGFPIDIFDGDALTIRVGPALPPQFEGSVDLRESTIQLSDEVLSWSASKLERVLRHELAHLALYRFMGGAMVPVWFSEGHAEWVSGDLSCGALARIDLDLSLRRRAGLETPRLHELDRNDIGRLAQDYWGSFFSFLEEQQPGALSDGRLLVAIRSIGIRGGFRTVFSEEPEVLERRWQRRLETRVNTTAPRPCARDPGQ